MVVSTQLLVGGRIYAPSAPDATAMAVTDGIVTWLGADKPALALHPDAEVVDLAGAFVAPAFVDAHVHTTALGLSLVGLDLSGCGSLADCLTRLRTYAAGHDDPVVWGHGWDETAWPEGRPPTSAEIAAAAPGRTVYLARVDVHSAICSPNLADGVVRGAEHHRVRAAARALLTAETRAKAQRAALDSAAAHGIVAIHECAGPDISGRDDLAALRTLDHGVHVRAYWGEAVDSPEAAKQLLADTGADGLAGDLFVDGSLGSHTAWLAQPYADADTCGTSYLDPAAITAHVRACTQAGVQAGFHVIGDRAVRTVVEAFAAVAAELGGPAVASCGHRLEHVEMVTTEQAAQLGRWGVLASVQPGFDAAWGGPDGMYERRLGAQRARAMNPFAALAANGVSLAIGTDAPVLPLGPWSAIRAAVGHRSGYGISPRAAFGAATRGAWRAGGVRDGVAGTLAPGAPASYAVWETGELVVAAAADSVQRWSTDPRSRVPGLPPLGSDDPDPICIRTVHRGATIYER